MKTMYKYLGVCVLSAGLVACGGDDDNDKPNDDMGGVVNPVDVVTIYDTASSSDNFTTLTAALKATGLDSVLDNADGNFTVFAPTDAAFAALGQDTINALLADSDTLSDILLYHVISGAEIKAEAALASAGNKVEMANGDMAALSLSGDSLYVNLSKVTATDITTSNGVIHVLDVVLSPPADDTMPTDNIVEIAQSAGTFATLLAAAQAAGLDSLLADETKQLTVFAPSDAAFEKLPAGTVTALLADTDALMALLKQHVVLAAVDSVTAFTLNGKMAETAGGEMIDIDIMDGMLKVGGATVTTADIKANNGVIHVIDSVIIGDLDVPMPSVVDVAVESGSFTTLVAALKATSLDVVLADSDKMYTVFAPTDAAFAALGQDTIDALLADTDALADILTYHVIEGAKISAADATAAAQGDTKKVATVNGAQLGLSLYGSTLNVNLAAVTAADVMAGNGVIHVIDKVILPPKMMGMPSMNIAETAIANGNFTTLVTALQAADLVGALSDESKTYTVFAPTDAAFDLIPENTLNALIADVPALTKVLLQHVVADVAVDSVTAFTFNGMNVDTMADEDVMIKIVDGMLEVQGAKVTMTDIYTNNGVIHVIDTVITETLP